MFFCRCILIAQLRPKSPHSNVETVTPRRYSTIDRSFPQAQPTLLNVPTMNLYQLQGQGGVTMIKVVLIIHAITASFPGIQYTSLFGTLNHPKLRALPESTCNHIISTHFMRFKRTLSTQGRTGSLSASTGCDTSQCKVCRACRHTLHAWA